MRFAILKTSEEMDSIPQRTRYGKQPEGPALPENLPEIITQRNIESERFPIDEIIVIDVLQGGHIVQEESQVVEE